MPSQIEQRQSSSELNRAKAHEEIREKQKKREEHAKKVKVSNRDYMYKRIINVCTYIFIQTRRGSTSDSVGVESMASTLEADSLYNADTTGEEVFVNKSSRYNVTFQTT